MSPRQRRPARVEVAGSGTRQQYRENGLLFIEEEKIHWTQMCVAQVVCAKMSVMTQRLH